MRAHDVVARVKGTAWPDDLIVAQREDGLIYEITEVVREDGEGGATVFLKLEEM